MSIITLGCAKNEVDSREMGTRLKQAGFSLVDDPSQADAIIVNTCSFIQSATEESLQAIFEVCELPHFEAGDAVLIVAGCMPARYGSELEGELPEARGFVPCSREDDIVAAVGRALDVEPCTTDQEVAVEVAPETVFSYVKISDGCDRFCSYCTIPFIRGRYHSFTLDSIGRDVDSAIASGAREIVLIGQDTGIWGTDFSEPDRLAHLLESLAQSHPDTWFRVMYLQPEGIDDQLIETMKRYPNICNYLDIPLQHCASGVLSAMNRKGSSQSYLSLIAHIRSIVPDITLRTTLIVGFPGESDADFDELLDFISEAEFDYIGVFPYSREEGTRAASLDNQIDEDVKQQRASELRDAADAVSMGVVASRIGSVLDVLVEGAEEDGQLYGRAQCQAPDVDGVTFVDRGVPGCVGRYKIADTMLYEMEGECEDE